MYRIIDGVLYEGKVSYEAWDVRVWQCGGHREISAARPIIWEERNALSPLAKELMAEHVAELTAEEKEAIEAEKRERNLERAARRARTKCRRLIKAAQFNEMLTLTYRENQTDRSLAKKHFKEWVRRMKKALGKFCYVAAPEPQARGAWHIHVATWKLPKMAEYQGVKIPAWRLGTEIWRDIVGEDNGLCFVGGKDRHGRPRRARMGIAELAAYVSKYITKGYADGVVQYSNRSRPWHLCSSYGSSVAASACVAASSVMAIRCLSMRRNVHAASLRGWRVSGREFLRWSGLIRPSFGGLFLGD
ncbi:UNVERIFIED_ORG: hypothetical protein ABIC43_004278 [Variovorax guangxiensis]